MVLFYVLIVCTVTLPPGVNPIAVDKYIYIYIKKHVGEHINTSKLKRICCMLYILQKCIIILVEACNCGCKNTQSWRTIVLSSLTFFL